VADWWPRPADVGSGLLLAREGPVDGLTVGLQFLPPFQHALGLQRFGGGWFLPAALQLSLGLPGSLPGDGRHGGPFLVPRAGRLKSGFLRGQTVSQCPGLVRLYQVVFCFGAR